MVRVMTQTIDLPNPVFVAIDTPTLENATRLVRAVEGAGGIKLGLEFFVAHGPHGIKTVHEAVPMVPIFLDLKLHDIPNTVAGAVRSVAGLQPAILTIHAAGGRAMMMAAAKAARESAEALGVPRMRVVAVTVLTSLDQGDLGDIGVSAPVDQQVLRLATLASECGLDGIVCSPHEAAPLRAALGPDFMLVIPGVRPEWAEAGDQKRVMTPRQAQEAGADVLVIGRPITGASDPTAALHRILGELS